MGNGKAERFIGTLFGMTRAMLTDANASVEHWNTALLHAAFLLNFIPRSDGRHSAWSLVRDQVVSTQRFPYYFQRMVVKRNVVTNSLESRAFIGRFVGYQDADFNKLMIWVGGSNFVVSQDCEIIRDNSAMSDDLRSDYIPPVDSDGTETFMANFAKIPRDIGEAFKSEDKEHWIVALEKEKANFKTYGTFVGVSKKEARKAMALGLVVGTLLLFSRTLDNQNKIKWKTRLVGRGDQQSGVDGLMLYSPTSPCDINKLLMNVAAAKKLKCTVFDVNAAFLEGWNTREEYVRVPQFFAKDYNNFRGANEKGILKVVGNFYGLRQAPRIWWKTFDGFLKRAGLSQSKWCSSLYFIRSGDSCLYLVIHVDDGLIVYNDDELLEDFKKKLMSQITKVTFSDDFSKFLGIEINVSQDGDWLLTHEKYLKEKLLDIHPVSTLPVVKSTEVKDLNESELETLRAKMGTVRFVVDRAYPSTLGYANELVSGNDSLEIVDSLLGFMKHFSTVGLKFGSGAGVRGLYAFADASWVRSGDAVSRVAGCYFINGHSGAFHSFSTKLVEGKAVIAPSSCYAEILAIYEVLLRGLYYLEVLKELNLLSGNAKISFLQITYLP